MNNRESPRVCFFFLFFAGAQCVLASIIVVALKGMLMKVSEFAKFWRLDKTDAGVWAVTFVVVVLFDVEYGLLVGVLLCVGRLLVLAVRPYTCKLALAPGTELYLDARRYKGVRNKRRDRSSLASSETRLSPLVLRTEFDSRICAEFTRESLRGFSER